jgi:hypothetical protein
LNENGSRGAIFSAGAAFHTGITVLNDGMFSSSFKNLMRTNFEAHTAAVAFIFIKFEGDDIL